MTPPRARIALVMIARDEALQAWGLDELPTHAGRDTWQILQAAALLAETPAPTDEDIDSAMSQNICRFGTYPRIRAAIKRAAGQEARA